MLLIVKFNKIQGNILTIQMNFLISLCKLKNVVTLYWKQLLRYSKIRLLETSQPKSQNYSKKFILISKMDEINNDFKIEEKISNIKETLKKLTVSILPDDD